MLFGNRLSFVRGISGIFFMLAVLMFTGFPQEAQAASVCKDGQGKDVQGFTVAMIFCIRSSITDALTGSQLTNIIHYTQGGYLTQVVIFLTPFKWAAITLAVALYGVKLMTVSVEELVKESSFLLFRIGFVLFLIDNLGEAHHTTLYSSQTGNGIYGAAADFAGEFVGFLSKAFDTIMQKMQSCHPPILPYGANLQEYKVWQAFDCIFQDLMGGSDAKNFAVAVVVLVLMASLFSGGFGIAVLILGITLFVMVLLSLMRAVYSVILAYFILALLIIIGPLIIPVLVFDSKFTQEIFWKWVSLIASIILQPLFIIGFLAFFIMTEYEFIDGAFPGCNMQSYVNDDNGVKLGTGKGICSFKQIMDTCPPDGSKYGYKCVVPTPIWTLNLNVNFPKKSNCHAAWCHATNGVTTVIQDIVNFPLDVINAMVNYLIGLMFEVPKIHNFPLLQFFVTLFAFIIITFTMMDLLKVVPHLAEQMTMSVGVGLMKMAQVPLEAAIVNAVKSGNEAMKGAIGKAKMDGKSGGGLDGLKNMLGAVGKGGGGAADSIKRKLIN